MTVQFTPREIASALGGRVMPDDSVSAPGPNHSKKDASLRVWIDPEDPDGFRVHSHADDDWRACRDHVCRQLGIETFDGRRRKAKLDGRPDPRPRSDTAESELYEEKGPDMHAAGNEREEVQPRDKRKRGRVVAEYIYRDADGRPSLKVCRMEPKGPFPQFHWTGSKWASGKPKDSKIPYRLPELIADHSRSVFICEGEKDVDRLVDLGFVATCNSEGADNGKGSKWTADLNQWFRGRVVYILQDNDEAGYKHAGKVAADLCTIAAEVRIIQLPGLPLKGDVSDWLDAGGDPEKLEEICRAFPLYEPVAYVSVGPFVMTADGLKKRKAKKAVDEDEHEVSKTSFDLISAPFEILGHARGPDGEAWARWVRFRDLDGRTHTYAIANKSLHGDDKALCQDLASRGLFIERSGRAALADYLNMVKVNARITAVPRTGWHTIGSHKVFALSNTAIGPVGAEKVILDASAKGSYDVAGTLDGWKKGVATLARGHSRVVLSVSLAFVGPLLAPAHQENFGLHLYMDSSKGKTSAAAGGASVWGKGAANGYIGSWRATDNGLEGKAAAATDTFLVLDEMGQAPSHTVGQSAYMLMNGQGKSRSDIRGEARDSKTWRIALLSTGELTLQAKVAEDRGQRVRAGQLVRLIEIPADPGKGCGIFDNPGPAGNPAELSTMIREEACRNYGHAGPAFVRRMIEEGPENVGERAKVLARAFAKRHVPKKADGQVERVAMSLGFVAAAGELATEWNITPWQKGEATTAAASAFKAWFDARGGAKSFEEQEAVSRVRQFIEAFDMARFDPVDITDPQRFSLNRAGWRKGDGEDRQWFILPEVWNKDVCKGMVAAKVAATLVKLGMLEPGSNQPSKNMRTPLGQKKVYVINASILEGGEPAASDGDAQSQDCGTNSVTEADQQKIEKNQGCYHGTSGTDENSKAGSKCGSGPFAADFAAFKLAPDERLRSPRDRDNWEQAVKDAVAFLLRWGDEALRLGWTAHDLFGLDPKAQEPLLQPDMCGIVWILNGLEVVEITTDGVGVESLSGTKFIPRPRKIPAPVF